MTVAPTADPAVALRRLDGSLFEHGTNWMDSVPPDEEALLRQLPGPVLDVGCGPGRHVATLASWGVPALGIDITVAAVETARGRGAPAMRRSVFGRVPGAGRWASALLLDGNIGIGGDPPLLLARVATLLRPCGVILVELVEPETPTRHVPVYLDLTGQPGPPFDWTTVAADQLPSIAARAELAITHTWVMRHRWFAALTGSP
jgi:SAM-dependent methyltransferase